MAHKILLVEDSETQLRFLKEGLEQNGYEVETASNGSEAYRKVYTTAPDIIVSDIVMPAIDGYQLCRMIKNVEETKKIPVILLTILDKKIDGFWGKKAGAQLFLSKSIDIQELIKNIIATVKRYPVSEEYKKNFYDYIDEFNKNSGKPYKVAASIGLICKSAEGSTVDNLIKLSDDLMYRDKASRKKVRSRPREND